MSVLNINNDYLGLSVSELINEALNVLTSILGSGTSLFFKNVFIKYFWFIFRIHTYNWPNQFKTVNTLFVLLALIIFLFLYFVFFCFGYFPFFK